MRPTSPDLGLRFCARSCEPVVSDADETSAEPIVPVVRGLADSTSGGGTTGVRGLGAIDVPISSALWLRRFEPPMTQRLALRRIVRARPPLHSPSSFDLRRY